MGLVLAATACSTIAGLDDFVDATTASSSGSGGSSGGGAEGQGATGGHGGTGGVTVAWARRFGGGFDEEQPRIAVAPDGAIAIAGFFDTDVTFDKTLHSAGGRDIFVAQLDASGVPSWSRAFGDSNDQCMSLDVIKCTMAVAVDSQGAIVIAGRFEGTIDLGGGALSTGGNAGDIVLAKLGADGTHQWSKSFPSPSQQDAQALAIDSGDNIILAGDFLDSVDLGGGTLTSAGGRDIVLAKLGPDGTHQWSKRYGDAEDQLASSVAVDGSDNIVVIGRFVGKLDFGDGGFSSSEPVGKSNPDVYLAKLGPDGQHQWSKRYGDSEAQFAQAVAAAPDGQIAITGGFDGTIDFGKTQLSRVGQRDMYLARLQPDGSELWSKRFGANGNVCPVGLGISSGGPVAATGYFDGAVDFGWGVLEADEGSDDAFVTILDAGGDYLFARDMGDYSTERGNALATAAGGDVVIAGDARGVIVLGQLELDPVGTHDLFVARLTP